MASEEARARGRTEMSATIMTYISDEVEVRSRIQNLKQRTDRTYRRHRLKPRVHMQNTTTSGTTSGTAGGGQVIATAGVAFVDNTTIAAVGADGMEGERGLESQLPREHDQLAQEGVNTRSGNALRLPPLVLPPITTAVTANNNNNTTTASTLITTQQQPYTEEDDTENDKSEATKKKLLELEEKKKREQYERKMSSIVAAADPWNLAPHTQPRPSKLPALSFYKKSKPL